MITAAATSGKTLGSCGASIGLNFNFLGFSTISNSVAYRLLGSANLISPLLCSNISALPPLDGSLGIAIVAFSGISSSFVYFLENTPNGSMWIFAAETSFKFLSLANFSKYG